MVAAPLNRSRFRRKINRSLVVGVSLAVIGAAAGCGGNGSGDSKAAFEIAGMADLTGTSAAVGATQMNGVRAAIEGANRRGGVDGQKINLTVRDDTNTPATAISIARSLLADKETLGLVGINSSFVASALAPLLEQYKAPVVAAGVPDNLVIPVQKYIFMTVAMLGKQGAAQVAFVASTAGEEGIPKNPKVAILHFDSPAATVWAQEAKAELKKVDLDLVAEQAFAIGVSDISAQANRIAQAQPDVVISFLIAPQVSMVSKALNAANLPDSVPLVQYSYGSAEKTMAAAGKRPYLALTDYDASAGGKITKQMTDDAKAIKVDPTEGAFVDGYAQGLIVLDALKRCGSDCTRVKFYDTLNKTDTDLDGFAFGQVVYNEKSHSGIKKVGFQKLDSAKKVVLVGDPQSID